MDKPAESTSPLSGDEPAQASSSDAGIDYSALYNEICHKPCQVSYIDKLYETGHSDRDVNAKPLRTKPHLIDRELQRVYDATTLDEVNAALMEATAALQELDVFRGISVLVTEQPEDEPESCTVRIDLEEKNWYKVHAATYLQGVEKSMELGVGLHNALGHCEHVTLSGDVGTENSSQYALSYIQPRLLGLPLTFDGRLQQFFRNHQKESSYSEQLRGLVLGLRSSGGLHSFQYELGWRNISDPSHRASAAVMDQLGDDLKSSLRYTYMVDRRVQPINPQGGWAVKATSELAGLGPQAESSPVTGRFVKQQVDFQGALPVAPGVALCLTLTAGVMLPWGSDVESKPTCIAERFHLGGPSSLRGFSFKGIGPSAERRAGTPRTAAAAAAAASTSAGGGNNGGAGATSTARDSLGGDLYTSILAALTFQIPTPATQALKVHAHMFVNGGNNVQLAGAGRSLQQGVQQFSQTLRWSAGVGLVLPTWFGRFEANYVTLLSHQRHDRIRPGLQLGFSTSAFM